LDCVFDGEINVAGDFWVGRGHSGWVRNYLGEPEMATLRLDQPARAGSAPAHGDDLGIEDARGAFARKKGYGHAPVLRKPFGEAELDRCLRMLMGRMLYPA